jgi:hypothetical protein
MRASHSSRGRSSLRPPEVIVRLTTGARMTSRLQPPQHDWPNGPSGPPNHPHRSSSHPPSAGLATLAVPLGSARTSLQQCRSIRAIFPRARACIRRCVFRISHGGGTTRLSRVSFRGKRHVSPFHANPRATLFPLVRLAQASLIIRLPSAE